jgi:hypothetical protein
MAATLLAAACSRGPLRVSTIQLGRELGADNSIAAHTTTFKPDQTIYVAVLTEETGAGTITARWMLGNRKVSEETKNVSYSGSAATEFHLQSADRFPSGQYTVEILVDGQPIGERSFRVDE